MQRQRPNQSREVPNGTGPTDDLFGYTQTSRAASVSVPTPIDDEFRLGRERPDRFELVADHMLTLPADRHVVSRPVERDMAMGWAPLEAAAPAPQPGEDGAVDREIERLDRMPRQRDRQDKRAA
jgi:hypothetical protein